MVFYDFEVFKYDWLVVLMDMNEQKETVIKNSKEELEAFYSEHVSAIWAGFNNVHYDQWIMKAILADFNPKEVNDYIIKDGKPGWKFSSIFRRFPMYNYDIMQRNDKGLKVFEGFMGNNIKETSIPFDIDRKLTEEEIQETIKYCRHDVEQTIQVFIKRKDDFNAHVGLVNLAGGDMSLLSKTKPQLSAIILNAHYEYRDDEFDIDFPDTLQISKYTEVLDWYRNPDNHCYKQWVPGKRNPEKKVLEKTQLKITVADCPHVFGYGGIHGALEKYHGEGYYLMADVASLYPSLMIRYNLHSRNMKDPKKFEQIYHDRLKLKKEKNPLQLPLKLVLNSTYGVMKDEHNDLCDPRQANRVCIYGQLLLLDLIEKLEGHCQLIQSNTDGILIKMYSPDDYYLIDDICYEWEQRTGLTLEFDEYAKVFQKDVNNYVIVSHDGEHFKSKGLYVKKLNDLDYDLPILNTALIQYMIHGIPVEQTITECNDLKEFQLVSKISGKYDCILYGDNSLKEQTIRVFASKDHSKPGVKKVHSKTGRPAKIANSPEHCFIWNDAVNGVPVPAELDKQWYINFALKRLKDFGV